MPNVFRPLGFELHEFMGHPLLAGDAAAQLIAGYNAGRGSVGSQDPMLTGGAQTPYTGSFVNQALASGRPLESIPRRPEMGMVSYALSKLGVLHPNIAATPDEIALQQRAIAGQAQRQQQYRTDIFKTAAEIGAKDPATGRLLLHEAFPSEDVSGAFAGPTQQQIENQFKKRGLDITQQRETDYAARTREMGAEKDEDRTTKEDARAETHSEFEQTKDENKYKDVSTNLATLLQHLPDGDPDKAHYQQMLQVVTAAHLHGLPFDAIAGSLMSPSMAMGAPAAVPSGDGPFGYKPAPTPNATPTVKVPW